MIGVIGSGSWATEIVHILSEQGGRRINWWVRDPEKVKGLQDAHPRLRVSSDLEKIVQTSDDLFVVVPSAFLESVFSKLSAQHLEGKNIISAVKGFVTTDYLTVTQFFQHRFAVSEKNLCAVSGPSHAEEVAQGRLTYLTVASLNRTLAERVQEMLVCDFLRTIYSDDYIGIECAAALKNIYAVAAGICYALGYGDNLRAVLVAAAMHEMGIFVDNMAADGRPRQMGDYIYVADLLATCYSQHSRNRTFGELLGRGYSAKGAQMMQKMVAEGYYSINAVEQCCRRLSIQLPIAQTLYRIIYEGRGVKREMIALTNMLVK